MAVPVLSWAEVCRRRLAAQHLDMRLPAPSFDRMVGDICGLHAQVTSASELAAAVRVDGLAPGAVATRAWEDRTLVKTWAMRGTLHFLLAEDFPLYVAALSNRRFDLDGPWLRYHGLTAGEVPALVDAVGRALDGRLLTREELGREVVRLLGDVKFDALLASGWGAVLKPVAFQGMLCFGPSEANRVTFARPDQWLGGFDRPDPVEALREVARRFLRAYGPARPEDFARWWGVRPAAVRGMFTAGDGFAQVEVDGKKMWTVSGGVSDETAGRTAGAPGVRLLPLFDPYTVAVRRGGARPLAGPVMQLVYRKAGWISPVLLVDGEIAGVWDHTAAKGGVRVDIRPFAPLDPVVADLAAAEAGRLGAHLGMPATVTLSAGDAGFTAGRGRKNL